MRQSSRQIDVLLDRTQSGDMAAGVSLLISHRQRLRNLISLRMPRNLDRFVDPSDIVQETLIVAARRLERYVDERPLPFYVWLRRLALDKLGKATHRYLNTQKRNGKVASFQELNDDSLHSLARNLVDTMPTPMGQAIDDEQSARVIIAVKSLPENQRSVIELRYLERMSVKETAAALEISETNVKQIHLRALKKLRAMLGDSEDQA